MTLTTASKDATGVDANLANAQLALTKAKQRLPIWRPLVRAIARNQKLEVALTGGAPSTDGKTVFLRVPIELAYSEHEKLLCGKWDKGANKFLCAACNVELECDVNLFHEVAHLLAGSFGHDDPDAELIALMQERWPTADFDITAMSIKGTGVRRNSSNTLVQRLANRFQDRWAFFAFNAVEDVYVNAMITEAREGLLPIFRASYEHIFECGVTGLDGTSSPPWNTLHPFIQAQAAWSLIASGQSSVTKHLDGEVVAKVMNSKLLMQLAKNITNVRKVRDRFKVAFQLLAELERLGLGPEPTPEPEPEAEPEPAPSPEPTPPKGDDEEGADGGEGEAAGDDPDEGDEADGDGAGDGGDTTEGDDEEEGGDHKNGSSSDSSDGESDATTSKDGEGVEPTAEKPSDGGANLEEGGGSDMIDHDAEAPSTGASVEWADIDDAIKAFELLTGHDDFGDISDPEDAIGPDTAPSASETELIETAVNFDGTLVDVGNIRKMTTDLGALCSYSGRPMCVEGDDDSGYHLPAEVRVPAIQRLRLMLAANKKSGIEHNLTSGRRVDRRTMGSRIPAGDDRIFERRSVPKKRDWTVLIGIDISGSTRRRALEIEKEVAIGIGDLLTEAGIPFSVYAHTGDHSDKGGYNLIILPLKKVGDLWKKVGRKNTAGLRSGAANLDGHTMQAYRMMLERQRGKDKLLLYFTDGAMPCENAGDERPLLINECAMLKAKGIHTIGVGIGCDDPRKYGLDTIEVNSVEDIPALLLGIGQRLVR